MKTKFFFLAIITLFYAFPFSSSADSERYEKKHYYGEHHESRYKANGYEHQRGSISDTSEIHGVIESMPPDGQEGIWIIDGLSVMVTEQTIVKTKHGKATIGRHVEVKGHQADKIFKASKIEIMTYDRSDSSPTHAKFYGTVQEMPAQGLQGIWLINNRKVLITDHTEIKEKYGPATIGSYVEVEGNFTGTTFTVYEIEVKGTKKEHNRTARGYNKIFLGKIETMPEDSIEGIWTVEGRRVAVNTDTIINETLGKAAPGNEARIKGKRSADGVTASEITITAVTQ